jgi:hypothetical protein
MEAVQISSLDTDAKNTFWTASLGCRLCKLEAVSST